MSQGFCPFGGRHFGTCYRSDSASHASRTSEGNQEVPLKLEGKILTRRSIENRTANHRSKCVYFDIQHRICKGSSGSGIRVGVSGGSHLPTGTARRGPIGLIGAGSPMAMLAGVVILRMSRDARRLSVEIEHLASHHSRCLPLVTISHDPEQNISQTA